jgi:hypothetical protein
VSIAAAHVEKIINKPLRDNGTDGSVHCVFPWVVMREYFIGSLNQFSGLGP